MHRRWMSLPLLWSCVSAFYPIHGGDGGDTNNKRFIPFSPSDRPSGEPGVFTLDLKKEQVKRDNKFPVILSNPPSSPNALAINQDGSDFSYFSTVKIGSSGKAMYMLIDTGSANTWVFGSGCKSPTCSIHNTIGTADSTTLKTTTTPWKLAYGTGEVDGVMASDTLAFAKYNLDMSFGLATTASDDFNNYPMDGILGFGPPKSNELGTKTIMQVLDEQTNLKDNILGIHLQRAADGTKDGELIIGGIDNTKFKGNLNYLSIQDPNSWEVQVDDVIVDGTATGLTGRTAIMDTGTSYILMPPGDAQTLHDQIPGSGQTGESFSVPCGTTVSLQVALNGVKYTIAPKDYVGKPSGSSCTSNIIGHQAFGPTQWILGDVFLKNVYTVFDFDKDRIGFGTPATPGSSSSSSQVASTGPNSSSDSGSTGSSAASSKPSTTMATATSPTSTSSSSSSSEGSGSGSSGSLAAGTKSAASAAAASASDDSAPLGGTEASSAGTRNLAGVRLAGVIAFAIGVSI